MKLARSGSNDTPRRAHCIHASTRARASESAVHVPRGSAADRANIHNQFLQGRPPGALYRRSPRGYDGNLPTLEYPSHFLVKRVTNAGTVRFKTQLLYVSTALKAHRIGLEEGR